MEDINHNVSLTSGELANLWSQYMNDSLTICVLNHSIKNVKDVGIKEILQFALSIAEPHIVKIKEFLKQENYPVPKGFTIEQDINLNAPPLFSDTFMLVYMHIMTLHGMTGYAGAVGTSVRADQITYFIQCNKEAMELYERTVHLMLKKGIYSRTPHINSPENVDFVNDKSYLTGWFGKKRPLNAMEISGLSFNMQKTAVKVVLEIGFGQVCQSKELQKYFNKGRDICKKHFETFRSFLIKDNLSSPHLWISEVTNSTVPPFSDKLMLFHIVTLVSAAIGFYSAGLSVSQRRDLALEYTGLVTEIGLYAEVGAQLLIKNGWLERPPLADDKDALSNSQ
ncbi:hypothetical protein G3A_08675 [Bacillus sp. 17376]|uniref:Uncharacterized protein n=1 Tax=Mesobacillus boroniphilus JCM 21738 TaxID=1294265 RepID=W4RU31_9BACI|nr:DUF3231 family protein [Mesobacillus boroniphilus]ESU33109.1 hypothetical protein G3A_08675 [Bacillus sp. 17376]GAE47159.1 hypothetical protein JCM21738_4109 [Mesobacillus boroniphilus JCM 21738]